MINGFPYLIPASKLTEDQHKELIRLAADDNHAVFRPTHIGMKDGRMIGYASIATPGMPVATVWASTKVASPRDSLTLANVIEGIVQGLGMQGMCYMVAKGSPFEKVMEPMGYQHAGEFTLHVKVF